MAYITITTTAHAAANGWTFHGSGVNWYGEKATGNGGKLLAVAAASADLLVAMNTTEYYQENFGTHGPKNSSFPGHI